MELSEATKICASLLGLAIGGCGIVTGPSNRDFSDFRFFELQRTSVLVSMVPVGSVYSAIIRCHEVECRAMLQVVDSIVDDEPVLREISRELGQGEIEELRSSFRQVRTAGGIALECVGAGDPAMITLFEWDGVRLSDFSCEPPTIAQADGIRILLALNSLI